MREYRYLSTIQYNTTAEVIAALNNMNREDGWRVVCSYSVGLLLVRDINE